MRAELFLRQFSSWDRSDRFVGAVLSLLLLFLPLFDPPTNFCLIVLFGVLLLALIRRPESFAPVRLDAGHAAFALLLIASLASTVWNLPFPDQFRGTREVAGFFVVYLLVSRLPVGDETNRWFVACMIVGLLLASLWGGFNLAMQQALRLELHAVGGPARAGIYLAVVLVAALGLVTQTFVRAGSSLVWRGTVVLSWAALVIALYLTGSRGALLAAGVGMVVYGIANRRLIGRRLVMALLVIAAASGGVLSVLPGHMKTGDYVNKTVGQFKAGGLNYNDSVRLSLQKYGLEVFRQSDSPWFGVGPRNFHNARPVVPAEMASQLSLFEGRIPHAHNLFINRLAEEGIVGLSALLLLFGVIASWLWQDARAGRAATLGWSIGLGGLLAPIIGGSFNTPWFRENALLAAVCFALYAAARRQSAAASQPA